MKTKAERFIDYVQSALIQNRHTVPSAPAVTAEWTLLTELEQASRAAMYIPDTLPVDEAALDFVRFLFETDTIAPDPADAPEWLRAYVIGELEMSVSERLS